MRAPSFPPTPCGQCRAACCRDKGDGFSVRLHPYEDNRPVFDVVADDRNGIRVIPVRDDGSCIFLDQEASRCSIYEDRPYRCKCYSCWDDFVHRKIPLDDSAVDKMLADEFSKHSTEQFPGLKRRAAVAE